MHLHFRCPAWAAPTAVPTGLLGQAKPSLCGRRVCISTRRRDRSQRPRWRRQCLPPRASRDPPSALPAPRRLSRVLDVATSAFPFWVTAGAVLAAMHPPSFLWFKPAYIVRVLALIMAGMGLAISPTDFAKATSAPFVVLLGAAVQYTVMPALGVLVGRALALPVPLAVGVILVAISPGGAASNLVCLIGGADVALSVVLTLVSTLMSIVMIPLLGSMLLGTLVPISALSLFTSTAQVVIFPLTVGAVIRRCAPGIVDRITAVMPLMSVIGITCICGAIVATNASVLSTVGPTLVVAITLMHALGGAIGYFITRLFRLPVSTARCISIETMMQNSSLAVSLSLAHFANPLCAVPGAISATAHSVIGSALAAAWRWADRRKDSNMDKRG